jgi:hypothetical protein
MASSGNPRGTSIAGEQEPRKSTSNGNPEDNHFNEKYDDAEDDAVSISDQQMTTAEERSEQPALHLTSDEVNYLIFRYVVWSTFTNTICMVLECWSFVYPCVWRIF